MFMWEDGFFSWCYWFCVDNLFFCIDDFNNVFDGEIFIVWVLLCVSEKWGVGKYEEVVRNIVCVVE